MKFRALLIMIGVVLSMLFELLYIGLSIQNIREVVDETVKEELLVQHDYFLDSYSECVYQVERLETFVGRHRVADYSKWNLNLVDDALAMKSREHIENVLEKLSVSSNVIDSFVVVGNNKNQKNLYVEIDGKKIVEKNFPTTDVIHKSGLTSILLANWGDIGRAQFGHGGGKAEFLSILSAEEIEEITNITTYLDGEYFVCNYVNDVLVIIRLNKDYINQKLDIDGKYSFIVYESSDGFILNMGSDCDLTDGLSDGLYDEAEFWEDENYYYRCTYDFHGDLNVITLQQKDRVSFWQNSSLRQGTFFLLTIMFVFGTGVAFLLLYFMSKKIFERFDEFRQVIRLQSQLHGFRLIKMNDEEDSPRKVTISNRIFMALVCSCLAAMIIASVFLNIVFEHTVKEHAYSLTNSVRVASQNKFEIYYDRYDSLSGAGIKKLIMEWREGDYQKQQELIKEFENDFYYETSFLPGYSYAFIVNCNTNVLYQTMLSSQTQISDGLVKQALGWAAEHKCDAVFVPVNEIFSGENSLAFVKKIYEDSQYIGDVIIVLEVPLMTKDYMEGLLRMSHLVLGEGNTLLFSYETLDTTSFLKDVKVGTYQQEAMVISADDYLSEELGRYVVISDYNFYMKKLEQGHIYSFLLMLVISVVSLLVSLVLRLLLIRPLNALINHMHFVPIGVNEKIKENVGLDEIDEIATVYNRMIVRLKKTVELTISQATKQQELELLQAQTEFDMLQQQINPHFVFNTLENINLLAIRHHQDDISRMVRNLAHIMRYTLNKSSLVKVKQEIEAVKAYIDIQRFRFDTHFDIVTEFDESLFECEMIKFIVQPLIENAISHGMQQTISGGKIKIALSCYEEGIQFQVSDNGIGMSAEILEQLRESIHNPEIKYAKSSRSGIGLKNVYRRIELYYQGKGRFLIDSKEGEGTRITIQIPFEPEDNIV